MKKIHILTSILLLFILSCRQDVQPTQKLEETAPDPVESKCLSSELLDEEIKANPQRAANMADLEEKIARYDAKDPSNARAPGKLYLPVVIHIVHVDPSIVPDSEIIAQVQVWNTDFNKLSARLSFPSVYLAGYPLSSVANCDIEFYVTNIIRVQTSVVEFQGNTSMKSSATGGSNAVDPATKLNVWVCNTPNGSSWGQYPGGNLLTDGLVIDYAFFGSVNPWYGGRVGTHEVGHWLSLRHIWGDRRCGNDLVNDTPEHSDASTGCPVEGLKSSCKNKPLVMWMNFMDYTIGNCKYMFTAGQKARMDATIENARSAYFSTTKTYPDILNVVWQ